MVVGTAEEIADAIETWFTRGAADGVVVKPTTVPAGLDRFVDQVLPVLVRRGLFRSEYPGTMLREHLGLPHPAARAR